MSRRNYLIYTSLFLALIAGMLFLVFTGSEHSSLVAQNTSVATSTAEVSAVAAPIAIRASAAPTSTSNASTLTSYTIPVLASESVFDAMRAYASTSNFVFTGRDYPSLGFFVESIDGKVSADGSNWMLYVNGKQSPKGASSEIVAPGDTVEWRYEKGY